VAPVQLRTVAAWPDIEETDVLSEREARLLREIEQRLRLYDPGFVALMARQSIGWSDKTWRRVQNAVIALSAVLATTCVVLSQVGAGMVAGLFASLVFAIRRGSISGTVGLTGRHRSAGEL
jgi:hypothetical protein